MNRPTPFTTNELRTLTERGLRIGALALELSRGPQFGSKRLSAKDMVIRLCESVDDAFDEASYAVVLEEALLTVEPSSTQAVVHQMLAASVADLSKGNGHE